MLPRSTACRHGDGRTWTKNASTSSTLPSRTIRLPGLMSRWARPASHSFRMSSRPSSMISSVTSASLISTAPSKNSMTIRYSRSGVISTMPYGAGTGSSMSVHEAQGVVLVLDEPADGLERGLVLQRAVEDRPAELVPAVGAHVVLGVQLGEDVGVRVAGDPQPQRGGPAGRLQPDRLDLEDREPELVGDGLPDRVASGPGDVQVGRLAPPVRHRERLVRGEPAEGGERDRHPQDDRPDDVGGMVHRRGTAGRRPRPRSPRRCRASPIRGADPAPPSRT